MRWTILFLFLATALPAQDIDIFADGEHGQLAGSYRNQGRHAPLVLIIPGSGPIDRNGLRVGVPGIGVYQRLADELEANNISSVRIDKRGGFASIDAIIDSDDFRISGYADDARAWVTRMQMLTDNCIWVFGHSEGGLVASVMVADDQSGICGLILAAAPGRPIDQVLYDQLTRYTKSNRVLGMIRNTLAQLKSGQEANPKTLPLLLRHLFTPTNQRYFIDWMTYDPAHVLANIKIPVLIIQGTTDGQITVEDAQNLKTAMPVAELEIIQGMNHIFQDSDLLFPLADTPTAPTFLPIITDFVTRK